MNYSVYKFNLDLASIGSQTYLTMKQGDTGRSLFITLSNKGQPYEIEDGCTAVFVAKKPDGNIIFNNCTIEDNTIHYKVTPQTSAAIGEAECEIRLYNGATLIASPSFTVLVNPAVYSDAEIIESVTEVSTLTSLIGEASVLLREVNASLDNGDFIPKLTVGTVTTLPAGSNATVTITGTGADPVLNFGIPQGDEGQAESLIPDTELSLESTKPVQNKVITAKINEVEGKVSANATSLTTKVDKESGKSLSTNDFTNEYKEKLDGIESGANKYVLEDSSVTAAKIAPNAVSQTYTATATVSKWIDSNGKIIQAVGVSGLKTTDVIIVDVDLSDAETIEACAELEEEWNKITRVFCNANGALRFYAKETPAIDLPVKLVVIRK